MDRFLQRVETSRGWSRARTIDAMCRAYAGKAEMHRFFYTTSRLFPNFGDDGVSRRRSTDPPDIDIDIGRNAQAQVVDRRIRFMECRDEKQEEEEGGGGGDDEACRRRYGAESKCTAGGICVQERDFGIEEQGRATQFGGHMPRMAHHGSRTNSTAGRRIATVDNDEYATEYQRQHGIQRSLSRYTRLENEVLYNHYRRNEYPDIDTDIFLVDNAVLAIEASNIPDANKGELLSRLEFLRETLLHPPPTMTMEEEWEVDDSTMMMEIDNY